MPMNVPFAGSHVRPVKAELSGDGGSIEVTVHNHDRAGLDDRHPHARSQAATG